MPMALISAGSDVTDSAVQGGPTASAVRNRAGRQAAVEAALYHRLIGLNSKVVLSMMERHQIRRVPVVNARGARIGMVAQADLAWAELKKDVAELVREISRDSFDPSR